MTIKPLLGALLLAASSLAWAQSATPAAGAPAGKKALAQRVVELQQAALDNIARNVVEQPARQILDAAEGVLQTRVAPEQREGVVKKVQDHVRKYQTDATATLKGRTTQVGHATMGRLLEEKFSETELRQLVASLDAPAYKRFQQTLPEISSEYVQALIKDLAPLIDPQVKTLEANVAAALGVPAGGNGQSAPPPPAPEGAKPAKP